MVAFSVAIMRWTSIAQRTASTALTNSTKAPSPVFFTMRPRCSAILGIDEFASILLECRESAFLVSPHQAAEGHNVCPEDRRKFSFNPRVRHNSGPPNPLDYL